MRKYKKLSKEFAFLYEAIFYISNLWGAKSRTEGKYDQFVSYCSAQILWEILINLDQFKLDHYLYKQFLDEFNKLGIQIDFQADINQVKKKIKKAINIFSEDTIRELVIEDEVIRGNQSEKIVRIIKPITDDAIIADYYESVGICYALRSNGGGDLERAKYCFVKAKEHAFKVRAISRNQLIASEKLIKEIFVDDFIVEIEELERNLDNFFKEAREFN